MSRFLKSWLAVAAAIGTGLCSCGEENRPNHPTLNAWVEEAELLPSQESFDREAEEAIEAEDSDREYARLRAEILGE